LLRTLAVAEALTVLNFSCPISSACPQADGNIKLTGRGELCNHDVSIKDFSCGAQTLQVISQGAITNSQKVSLRKC